MSRAVKGVDNERERGWMDALCPYCGTTVTYDRDHRKLVSECAHLVVRTSDGLFLFRFRAQMSGNRDDVFVVGGPGFRCPKCGGSAFGTICKGSHDSWVVHCHSSGCGWSGKHRDHVLPVEVEVDRLVSRGFLPGDAEKVESFARRLFFTADKPLR